KDSELVTQVFKFNTLDPEKAANIIRPLLSKQALVEPSEETRHLIVTDLVTNVRQIALLFKSIDSPNSGLVIGQYVVRNSFMDTLIALARQIMQPIAKDQSLTFVPHPAARSVFIVSTPFLVERTISVLQHIDSFQGTTRIYELEDLKFDHLGPSGTAGETKAGGIPESVAPQSGLSPEGKWETSKGNWIFRPSLPSESMPQGQWIIDQQKLWYFQQEEEKLRRPSGPVNRDILTEILRPGEIPRGQWTLQPEGSWVFQLAPGEFLQPERLRREAKLEKDLPVGHIDRTRFYIHKLQYRRGGDIVNALQQIGSSLQAEGAANKDLAFAIQNTQWLETSNSLVITGTESSILKVKELIDELDIPLRQVFIEMLILQTTVDDSLEYGVDFGTRSGGGNTATSQAFLGGASALVGALDTAGVGLIPTAATVARIPGFNMGIIGQRITHNGTQFASLGALVRTLHTRSHVNIVMNPKIITEDNKPAEIFVGINTPFQTQTIANNEGSIITTNVEFRDVGTTLKVTPLIGAGDIITLEIHEEVSSIAPNSVSSGGTPTSTSPTTNVNRTTTFVHVPDKHFVIISGMLNDSKERDRSQLPCLGGIPILGAAVSDKINRDSKLNLMIFIRPQIIDTEEQFRTVTRRQQDDWKQKNRVRTDWQYEVDQALDFLNIRPQCSPCDNDCTD
ncbi:MAG TPA: secretin N-terminal domain-containing protein, partial [Waddliaceae bacterium]